MSIPCARLIIPTIPRWLKLCDEYGLYVIDEADLECHGMCIASGEDGKNAWDLDSSWQLLSNGDDWTAAYVDRAERMVGPGSQTIASIIILVAGQRIGLTAATTPR